MKLADRCRGRWPEILIGIGVAESALSGKHGVCPACGGHDRFRYLRDDDGGFFCSSLRGDGVKLVQHLFGLDFKQAAERIETVIGKGDWKTEKRDSTYAERLRSVAQPSKRSAYLASRGLIVPPGLLFARGVEYHDEGKVIGKYDAMLAPVTRGGKWLTYHVTYLSRGRKADVPTPRKVLPLHAGASMSGAGVELYPAEEVMGVAEGIETAIAAHMIHGLIPVHAALNAGMLAKWIPPSIAKRVLIFADHDLNHTGQAAAWQLSNRLRLAGLETEILIPEKPDMDWNDELLKKVAA